MILSFIWWCCILLDVKFSSDAFNFSCSSKITSFLEFNSFWILHCSSCMIVVTCVNLSLNLTRIISFSFARFSRFCFNSRFSKVVDSSFLVFSRFAVVKLLTCSVKLFNSRSFSFNSCCSLEYWRDNCWNFSSFSTKRYWHWLIFSSSCSFFSLSTFLVFSNSSICFCKSTLIVSNFLFSRQSLSERSLSFWNSKSLCWKQVSIFLPSFKIACISLSFFLISSVKSLLSSFTIFIFCVMLFNFCRNSWRSLFKLQFSFDNDSTWHLVLVISSFMISLLVIYSSNLIL